MNLLLSFLLAAVAVMIVHEHRIMVRKREEARRWGKFKKQKAAK